jgi:outer membrane protein TolC
MIKYTVKILVLLGISMAAQAQSPRVMSLKDCIDYAIKNHSSITNLKFEEALQQAKNDEITALTRPQVKAEASLSSLIIVPKSRSDASAFGGAFNGLPFLIDSAKLAQQLLQPPARYSTLKFALPFNAACTLSASQILFDPGIVVALEAREKVMELTRINTELGAEGIRFNVSKAYYNALIAQRRIKSLEDNIKLVNDFYQLTDKLFKEGFAEKIDADRLLVQKNNLEVERNKIENLIQVSNQLLKFQMGMPLNEQIMLSDSIDMNAIDQSALSLDLDFGKRIEIQQLNMAKRLLQLDERRQAKSYLPTVVAFSSAGLASSTKSIGDLFTYSYFPNAVLGVQASLPIYDGGARTARRKQAQLKVAQMDNTRRIVENGIGLEAAAARTQLKNSILTYENQKSNVALAQRVLNTAQKKYKEGLGSTIEVLQAQTALKDAQTNFDAALFEVTSQYIDLQKALGNLK